MNLSYDYSDLLKEIKEEIKDGTLTPESEILLLRGSPLSFKMIPEFRVIAIAQGANAEYRPIIDWYYDDLQTEKILANDPFDDAGEAKEKKSMREQFKKDRPNMKTAKVRDVIAEMEEWSKIL